MKEQTSKLTVFKIFEDCFTKRSGGNLCNDPEFEQAMNNFMLCRIYRMHDFLMNIATMLDRYQTVLSKKELYMLAYASTPKRARAPYADFIRKKKKEEVKNDGCAVENNDGFAVI